MSLGIYERSVGPGGLGGSGSYVGRAIGSAVNGGVNGFNSVAALLAGRSPGERVEGALASLKHKRQPVLHQRALAKVRRPSGARPLGTGIVPPQSAAPFAAAPPAAASPLFNAVSAAPPATIIPAVGQPGGGGGTFFPGVFSPGGGGGGVVVPSAPDVPVTPPIIPPVVTPPVIPPVVVPPSAVPEPGSWGMMLIGFGLIGWSIRRRSATAAWLPAATR